MVASLYGPGSELFRPSLKIFFNYPGPPAPAVTDVNAFATCP
jgi:hypothetical protein